MITVKLHKGEKSTELVFEEAVILSDIIKMADEFYVDFPCGGRRKCGKCKVKALGNLSEISLQEKRFLSNEDIENKVRLACFAKALGDAEIYLEERETKILSLVKKDNCSLTYSGYGFAVDIGTTTLAVQLYDLSSGMLLEESLGINSQGAYGADVVSRMNYTIENSGDILHKDIINQISDMASECMKRAEVYDISKSVVTGHTVMLHFYENLSVKGISAAPFKAESLFGRESPFALAGSQTYLPACISAYIGGDIVCSIIASEMDRHDDRIELLADLGTNGELVLNYYGKLYCASTAAGPAFEGENLTCGMRSDYGAISRAYVDDDKIFFETLGKVKATGICGSGIIDFIKIMIEINVMDETGKINKGYSGIGKILNLDGEVAWEIPGSSLYITQMDVRQIQLAKSAIFAGIKTLLDEVKISPEDIDAFYISGGFGYYMDIFNAAEIGIFPKELKEVSKIIGNGALAGAVAMLLDEKYIEYEKSIASRTKEVILSGNEKFSDYYIENMLFGEET